MTYREKYTSLFVRLAKQQGKNRILIYNQHTLPTCWCVPNISIGLWDKLLSHSMQDDIPHFFKDVYGITLTPQEINQVCYDISMIKIYKFY